MLSSRESIVTYRGGRAFPDRLTRKTHGHYLEYARRMLEIYGQGRGLVRQELHRKVEDLFVNEPDCDLRRVRAFNKLLDDASHFETDPEAKAAELRLQVFSLATQYHPLVREKDHLFGHDEKVIKERVAEAIGLPWPEIESRLYADTYEFQRLDTFRGFKTSEALLARYNVAQVQACLFRARRMTVRATDDFKTILRYAKLARLLHEIQRTGPSAYRMEFSGPASVLRETRRYGINFSRFLPALLACKGWSMMAEIQTPWDTVARLELSDRDGLTSHLPPPQEFDSGVEEHFAAQFGRYREGWRLVREGEVLFHNQSVFVPDFVFRHEDGREILLEIVGFWTPEYLARKRRTLQQFRDHQIILAIPERTMRPEPFEGRDIIVYKSVLKAKDVVRALRRIVEREWLATEFPSAKSGS